MIMFILSSKQLSNIISGSEKEADVCSSEVLLLKLRDFISSFVPATYKSSQDAPQLPTPVLSLANLAQNMENTTINITLNTNVQMPLSKHENSESNASSIRKRRRALSFYDS